MGGGISDNHARNYTPVTQKTGTYPLLRWPVAPRIKEAPGSSDVPALPPSLEQKSSLRPPSCIRIPVPLLRPGSKGWSWQALFFWSGRHWQFSDGQKGEIYSVSVLREIPMHGGGSDLAAGLNHVMRAPRGSESLPEKIDFTPKGNGVWRGKGGKAE